MDFISKLETEFSKKHNQKYGVVVNTGTSALTLAVKVLGIGPGDEVICPDFTMIATAWAIEYNGATPVYVDCDYDYCIDVYKIERAITKKTKAIMVAHIYGRIANMDKIMYLAKKYNLKVIEDCCEVHGAMGICKGDISCFSFYKNKIVHSEEGGICLTNSKKLTEKMNWYKSMCFNKRLPRYKHADRGFNFRMPESQAKMAYKSFKKMDRNNKKRIKIAELYDKLLNRETADNMEVAWVYTYTTRLAKKLLKYLQDNKVEARDLFYPITKQETGMILYKDGLYLPIISKKETKKICKLINKFYGKVKC